MKTKWIICGLLFAMGGSFPGCGSRTPYTITEKKTEASGTHWVVEVPENSSESQLRTWATEITEQEGTGTPVVTFFQSGDKGGPPVAIYSGGMMMMLKR